MVFKQVLKLMIVNFRNFLKSQLGRFYLTNLLYTLKPKNRKLIARKSTQLCVEGYPRSANTFAVLAIELCSNETLKIAHHMHSSSQIKYCAARNIPTILLIRNPHEAIVSNVLREQGMTLKVAIRWYITFHKDILPFLDKIIVWEFDDFVKSPKVGLEGLKDHGFDIDSELYDKSEIYARIDELDRFYKKNSDFEKINTRPNKEKNKHKVEIIKKLDKDPGLLKLLHEAEDLFRAVIERKSSI